MQENNQVQKYSQLKKTKAYIKGKYFIKDYTDSPLNFQNVLNFYKYNVYPFVPKICAVKDKVIFFELLSIEKSELNSDMLYGIFQSFHKESKVLLSDQEKEHILSDFFVRLNLSKEESYKVGDIEVLTHSDIVFWKKQIIQEFVSGDFCLIHGDFSIGNIALCNQKYYLLDFDESMIFPQVYDFIQWQSQENFSCEAGLSDFAFTECLLALFLVDIKSLTTIKNMSLEQNKNVQNTIVQKKNFYLKLKQLYLNGGTYRDILGLKYMPLDYTQISRA